MDAMCAMLNVDVERGGARVDGTLFQIVCEPASLGFRLTTRKRRGRWVDIPLAALLTAPGF